MLIIFKYGTALYLELSSPFVCVCKSSVVVAVRMVHREHLGRRAKREYSWILGGGRERSLCTSLLPWGVVRQYHSSKCGAWPLRCLVD